MNNRYEIPLGEEYYQNELDFTRTRLHQSIEIIARLNAENHALHTALTLAQVRATVAEREYATLTYGTKRLRATMTGSKLQHTMRWLESIREYVRHVKTDMSRK